MSQNHAPHRSARRPVSRFAALITALILAALGVAGPLAGAARAEDAKLDFTLPTPEGKQLALKDLLAKGPVLITFWATFCKPCKKELPHLEALYKEFAPQGLTVVAISIDEARNVSKVKPYIDSSGFSFPVCLDTNGEVKRRFHVMAMPTMFILGKDGKKIYSKIGYNPGDEKALRERVVEIMKTEGVSPATGSTGTAGGAQG